MGRTKEGERKSKPDSLSSAGLLRKDPKYVWVHRNNMPLVDNVAPPHFLRESVDKERAERGVKCGRPGSLTFVPSPQGGWMRNSEGQIVRYGPPASVSPEQKKPKAAVVSPEKAGKDNEPRRSPRNLQPKLPRRSPRKHG